MNVIMHLNYSSQNALFVQFVCKHKQITIFKNNISQSCPTTIYFTYKRISISIQRCVTERI